MKFRMLNLHLETKKQGIDIQLNSINYFHGPISTGKSTIGRLIMYCLGKNMIETPALTKEFVSAKLSFETKDYSVVSERKKESSKLIVSFRKLDNNEPESVIIPAKGSTGASVIPKKEIMNMSDFLFFLSGIEPPKVRRSRMKEDTELIRLSFHDLLWYCYLPQNDMDSSFFNLGKDELFPKRLKSHDVLRYVFGYYQEKVSHLENELVESRQEQLACKQSAEQIRDILKESKIEETEKILEEQKELQKKVIQIEKEIKEIREKSIRTSKQNIVDELKEERRYLSNSIEELEIVLPEINNQISNQTKLKHEFLTAAMKSERTRSSMELFKKIKFETCPNCGLDLLDEKSENVCLLCKQPKNLIQKNFKIDSELNERAIELTDSINKFQSQKKVIQSRLTNKIDQKNEIDEKINELEKKDDSRFLTAASNLLKEHGILKGKLEALKKLLPLPKKADDLEARSYELESEIAKNKDKLTKARKEAEKNRKTVEKLKEYFLDNLKRSNFPEIKDNYEVIMNTKDFLPYIKPKDEGELETVDFFNAGSGGKQTLFKTCFALAMHRLSISTSQSLPPFLIIDSPMKNIEKEEDKLIFKGFHKLIYELAKKELKDIQFILIGSAYLAPEKELNLRINERRFTQDIKSKNPPLISYYSGQ